MPILSDTHLGSAKHKIKHSLLLRGYERGVTKIWPLPSSLSLEGFVDLYFFSPGNYAKFYLLSHPIRAEVSPKEGVSHHIELVGGENWAGTEGIIIYPIV